MGTTRPLSYEVPGRRIAVPCAEEFPSLGGLRASLPTKKEPARSFAELSREWVKASKEQEEAEKKRVEEERPVETVEKVFRHRVISLTPQLPSEASATLTPVKRFRKEDDGIGGTREEWSDESDRLSEEERPTEILSPSDEDPDEFNSNIVWDRRGKNEMY